MDAPTAVTRTLSRGEEIANAVTHGAGLVASLVAFPFLVAAASRRWGIPEVVGSAVFASSLVALYLVSTLYHAMRPSRAKQVLQKLDHTAIYLLIAGSYTPFTLGVLRGPWGWTLFSLVWAIAGTGIALEFAFGKKVQMPGFPALGAQVADLSADLPAMTASSIGSHDSVVSSTDCGSKSSTSENNS